MKQDVHTSHCCAIHTCKYNSDDCTVVRGEALQENLCEECEHDAERCRPLQNLIDKYIENVRMGVAYSRYTLGFLLITQLQDLQKDMVKLGVLFDPPKLQEKP